MSHASLINNNVIASAAKAAGQFIWEKFPALSDWISGKKTPTIKQLAEFANKVNIPFGYFFLQSLPTKENTIPLFRTGHKKPIFDYSVELSESISNTLRRQDWLVEYLVSEGMQPLKFVGSVDETDDYITIATKIRKIITLDEGWAKSLDSKDQALNYLISKIEKVGIYVVVNGVVDNNNHKPLNRDEFQGFVLTNKYAPFIFLNGKAYKAAQIFTLMHELAHIWFGASSITDKDNFVAPNDDIERLCDLVAAELLVSENYISEKWKEKGGDFNKKIAFMSNELKVSTVVIARRLLDIGEITKQDFFTFYSIEKKKWDNHIKTTGGGDFYNNQPFKVGRSFFRIIDGAAKSGKILYSDAYRLTGLYGNTYHSFSDKMN